MEERVLVTLYSVIALSERSRGATSRTIFAHHVLRSIGLHQQPSQAVIFTVRAVCVPLVEHPILGEHTVVPCASSAIPSVASPVLQTIPLVLNIPS